MPKLRIAFSEDGTRIRASQGHSVGVDLLYELQVPPEILYHGTATRFFEDIRRLGLLRMNRHHVHLSTRANLTTQVGARHGTPVLLTVRAGEMHPAGHIGCSQGPRPGILE